MIDPDETIDISNPHNREFIIAFVQPHVTEPDVSRAEGRA
jgi:hypothetical protein